MREDFELPVIMTDNHQEKPPIIIQAPRSSLLGRLAMGVMCSALVTTFTYFVQFRKWIIHILALIVSMGGHHKVERVDGQETKHGTTLEKLSGAFGKAKDILKDKVDAAKEPVKQAVHKVEEKVEKAEEKVKEAKKEVVKKADGIITNLGKVNETHLAAAKEAAEKREKDRIAYAEWQRKHGPNGRCPACKQGMRVKIRGTAPARCPNCGTYTPQGQIRAMGPPPLDPRRRF